MRCPAQQVSQRILRAAFRGRRAVSSPGKISRGLPHVARRPRLAKGIPDAPVLSGQSQARNQPSLARPNGSLKPSPSRNPGRDASPKLPRSHLRAPLGELSPPNLTPPRSLPIPASPDKQRLGWPGITPPSHAAAPPVIRFQHALDCLELPEFPNRSLITP
jgi:hypothetical protein